MRTCLNIGLTSELKRFNGRHYAIPSDEDESYDRIIVDERNAFLNRLLSEGDVFTYLYDFGDNWEHLITVESINYDLEQDPDGSGFVCDGAKACPPEDVGGTHGYHEFLETLLTDPKSEDAQRMHDWCGGHFDPEQFDIRLANAAILRMLYNRWGGK